MKYLIKQRTEELIMEWDYGVSSHDYYLSDFRRRIPRIFYESLKNRKYHDNPIKPIYSEVDIKVGDYVDGHLVKYRNIINGIPVLELSDIIKKTIANRKEDVADKIRFECVVNKAIVRYHDILKRMYDRSNENLNERKLLPIEFLSEDENMYYDYVEIFYNVKCKTPLERFAKRMQFIN